MSFTTSAFIRKNTPELRKKLEELGITSFLHNRELNAEGGAIKVFGAGMRVYSCSDSLQECDGVDCSTNEPLFLALVALRDDSDYMQWFTDGKDWLLCEKDDWVDEISSLCVGGNYNYDRNGELSKNFHKAIVQELIEHFK